ncbi:MAG TPA: hypothetical protein VJ349_12375, partial [Stellaceae bacterium]|nr:hypothetical protein [Stellaceae bacterium]
TTLRLPRQIAQRVRAILRLGLPIGGLIALEVGVFAVAGILMGLFGADALAARPPGSGQTMAGGAFYGRVALGADRQKIVPGAGVQLPHLTGLALVRVPAQSPYRPDSGRSAVSGGTSLHAPMKPFPGLARPRPMRVWRPAEAPRPRAHPQPQP